MLVTRIRKPDEWPKTSSEFQTKAAIVSNLELPHTNTTPSSRLALCQGLFQRFYPNLSGARIQSLKSDVSRVGCWCQKLFPGICNGCRHLWHLWWWCLAPLKSKTMSNGGKVRQQNTFSLYTHSSNDGEGFFLDNFEKIESFRTFLEQWEQMDKKMGNNEFSWEESIAIQKINKN